jgi:metal transporter CNNM
VLRLQLDTELIGEEIYDEFDREGARHGEVTSYVPPQSTSPDLDIAPPLKRKVSAPELSTRSDTSTTVYSPAEPSQRSASTSSNPVLRPIAIPAFKSLSFLTGRSRSMPPIPRDTKHPQAPPARPSLPEAGDEKPKHNNPASDSVPVQTDEKPPEIMITPLINVPATPAPAYLPLPVPVSPMPSVPINEAARVRQGANTISRGSSPGPSLSEALLRARRPASPHPPGTSPPKGTRFKSSFTGVADHVLRLEGQHQQQAQPQTSGDLQAENRNGATSKNGSAGDGAEMQDV